MPDLDLSPPAIFKEDLGHGRGLWSSEDTYRQLLATGLLGADWAQTRSIAKGINGVNEGNKLLGPHPSTGMVNNYFAASILADALIASQLPPELRKLFQYGTIGLEAPTVGRNKLVFNIGMKFQMTRWFDPSLQNIVIGDANTTLDGSETTLISQGGSVREMNLSDMFGVGLSHVSFGTGAPSNSNGSNGDIYFRSDGGALTTIYQKRTGAWVGIV